MFKVVILLCAVSTDPADCTPATALSLAVSPQESCGAFTQAMAATNEPLRPRAGESYLKTVCERQREARRD